MDKGRAFRLVRLWLGGLLVSSWAGMCFALLIAVHLVDCGPGGVPDCGGSRRTLFFGGFLASPLLLAGLPLLATGLPARRLTERPGGLRLLLAAGCFVVAAVFGLLALATVADLGAGTGAEILFAGLAGSAGVAAWSGIRIRR